MYVSTCCVIVYYLSRGTHAIANAVTFVTGGGCWSFGSQKLSLIAFDRHHYKYFFVVHLYIITDLIRMRNFLFIV